MAGETGCPGPTQQQHRAMHALWREAGVGKDRDARLALAGAVVGRRLASSNELTEAEADALVAYMRQLKRDRQLAAKATAFLARAGLRPIMPIRDEP